MNFIGKRVTVSDHTFDVEKDIYFRHVVYLVLVHST